jgi:osmoprotectant transport system permease protein
MGMTESQLMRRVELPLALPIIFAGLRVASVNVVATATIAPIGSVDSLGTPIISDNVYGADGRLGAAIAVTVLTLAIAAGLAALQRAVTPRGLKLAADSPRRRGPLSFLRRRETATP